MQRSWTRRAVLAALAVCAGVLSLAPPAAGQSDTEVRPFKVQVPQADLDDLHKRIAATRWPDKETVGDRSQGAQLAQMQELVRYWGSGYDWRKLEARLNALPQYTTRIDGVDIHFIHVRSRHSNALPVIVTHGWPGSIVEQLKIIAPLTDPTAHGGDASDAFDVVIPSVPGYGFSGRPTDTGWDPDRIARAWAELMKRLGYSRYVAQGCRSGSLRIPPRRRWRATYVATAVAALYLNSFVLVAQTFVKNPALKEIAPTQSEPPFVITQALVLITFVVLRFLAVRRFHPEPGSVTSPQPA